jgi:hypothetical protein
MRDAFHCDASVMVMAINCSCAAACASRRVGLVAIDAIYHPPLGSPWGKSTLLCRNGVRRGPKHVQ